VAVDCSPRFASDLPGPSHRAGLAERLDTRALLPRVELVGESIPLEVHDDLGKVVLRGEVAVLSAADPSRRDHRLPLRPRFTLQPIRGFAGGERIDSKQIMPFFTMVDRRKAVHLETMEGLPARYPQLLGTAVPASSDVERMSVERRPLGVFAPGCAADLAYTTLWREVRVRVGL
jgi:hypothetical protein